ncbi:hypothetical protein VB716_08990 [Synechococcus sp. CCY9201]|jgi:hypothetical protein|uniref:hypothetical protein n=1 Tax=unclassified Synechococcus TaxID=2626047 RepID=UPI0018CEA461|nr:MULTISPECIES: hypothetical protein [unclassified Synechococcus]MEA5423294.1 hypothetical protein [Synechococcus sp. CCY9202]MEA5474356.1 hypothetical protein [Synechococcus sp. CCY9201]QPN60463.1 hypothetical protein H8F24_03200 [Synechococcus sp. CBW1002]CAK6688947.1 hypothetical protein IFHNHDMJ_00510 [Synechococcus sp. CBW1107]
MSAPQSLFQAAVNRFTARLGSGLADAAAGLAALAQEAPERLQQEWQLFWQEVELEAERLERSAGTSAGAAGASVSSSPFEGDGTPGEAFARDAGASRFPRETQAQIDALRAQVAAIARRLDERPAVQD